MGAVVGVAATASLPPPLLPCPHLANVLLHQLRPRHPDEGAVCVVRDRAREQRLARARRPVHDHALGLRDAERFKQLGVLDRELDHLLDLLDLAVQPAHHVVRGVGHLLHLHQGDEGVDLGGEEEVEGVGIGAQRGARAGLDGGDVDRWVDVHHVLAFRVHLDQDLGLAHDLRGAAGVGGGWRGSRRARRRAQPPPLPPPPPHLDHLPDVRPGLLQQLQLLAQQAH